MANKSNQAYKIAMVGLLAALSYVVFTYGQVKITLPGGDATSIHLGNAVCVIGALLVGGFYGGLGGAIGMTIGDLLDPVYIVYAPKTFICKLCIGLIAGFVAHRLGKIDRSTDKNHIFPSWSAVSLRLQSTLWQSLLRFSESVCLRSLTPPPIRRNPRSAGVLPCTVPRSTPRSYSTWSMEMHRDLPVFRVSST